MDSNIQSDPNENYNILFTELGNAKKKCICQLKWQSSTLESIKFNHG